MNGAIRRHSSAISGGGALASMTTRIHVATSVSSARRPAGCRARRPSLDSVSRGRADVDVEPNARFDPRRRSAGSSVTSPSTPCSAKNASAVPSRSGRSVEPEGAVERRSRPSPAPRPSSSVPSSTTMSGRPAASRGSPFGPDGSPMRWRRTAPVSRRRLVHRGAHAGTYPRGRGTRGHPNWRPDPTGRRLAGHASGTAGCHRVCRHLRQPGRHRGGRRDAIHLDGPAAGRAGRRDHRAVQPAGARAARRRTDLGRPRVAVVGGERGAGDRHRLAGRRGDVDR